MKYTKSFFAVLSSLLCILLLISCAEKPYEGDYVIESYDGQSRIPVSLPEETATDASDSPEEPSFLVKEKRFTRDGNNLMILEVTNESAKDFDITVSGTYYDASGNPLRTETQSFSGFPAGYQNVFLFDPQIPFTDFRYVLETAPCEEPVYAHLIGAHFTGASQRDTIDEDKAMEGDFTRFPTLYATFTVKNESPKDLQATFVLAVYNQRDEIVDIYTYSPVIPANTPFEQDYKSHKLYRLQDGETEFPEKYQGDLRAIIGVKQVEPYGK